MIEKHTYKTIIIVFSSYLIWVWFFDLDESMVPEYVVNAYLNQPWYEYLFLPERVSPWIYDIRKVAAFASLIGMYFYKSWGRWLFLAFSISGLLLHTGGWHYELLYVTNIEWLIQMLQGGLIAMCFIGVNSREFNK